MLIFIEYYDTLLPVKLKVVVLIFIEYFDSLLPVKQKCSCFNIYELSWYIIAR